MTRRSIEIPDGFPTITVLCGSTRFKAAFEEAQRTETLAGKIVLTVGMFGHVEGIDMTGPVKAGLDVLHLKKIDLADEILFLNVMYPTCPKCGLIREASSHTLCMIEKFELRPYIGESTRRELAYARQQNKVIRFLNPCDES